MTDQILKIKWSKDQLFKGCILASIAHAIMVAHYPELSNEHSWDGMNYSLQDNRGIRGTITFADNFCIAAFRNDQSERLDSDNLKNATEYFFSGAPKEVINLAKKETFQYLLDNINGKIMPLITAGFWGIGEQLFTKDAYEEMIKNGCSIIETQVLPKSQGINTWKRYYDMTEKQIKLLVYLYDRKINNPQTEIILTKDEII